MTAAAAPPVLAAERRPPAGGGPADALVVLVHGYGADGHDLVALADVLGPHLPAAAFAAPHAADPCAIAPEGREWFPLARRDPHEYRAGVAAAWPRLDAFVRAERQALDLAAGRVALFGFSQGAMLALAVALLGADRPCGVLGYSGRLVLPADSDPGKVAGLPVLLVHGTDDPVIPAQETRAASERLAAMGCSVDVALEEGLGHAISPAGLDRAGTYLAKLLQP